ncbi:MAG: riboflavin synthase [Phycisphaerales bacterium]|nr:riboflavin synthase [Phycisphaerales bacterium]
MFTGIIQHVGRLQSIRSSGAGKSLVIDLGPLTEDLRLGDSVAVDGVCLTATTIDKTVASFDVVSESLSRTTLGKLQSAGKVNLERALAATGRFDGHIVQGHVDGLATVSNIRRGEMSWEITFKAPADILALMVPKGSIAIAGVSLTLANVTTSGFSIAVIPATLRETTLGELAVGQQVNIETDILGKYIRRYLSELLANPAAGGTLSLDKLRQAGFA